MFSLSSVRVLVSFVFKPIEIIVMFSSLWCVLPCQGKGKRYAIVEGFGKECMDYYLDEHPTPINQNVVLFLKGLLLFVFLFQVSITNDLMSLFRFKY